MNGPIISGSAPYLADRASPPTDAWRAEAATAGGTGTQQITQAGPVDAPAAVAHALDLPVGTPVVLRKRLILLDSRPVETATAYYPLRVVAGTPVAEPRKVTGGVAALLAERGWVADRTREEISARPATPAEREELALDEGEPVLVLTRLSITSTGMPFEYAIMVMRTQGRILRYDLGHSR